MKYFKRLEYACKCGCGFDTVDYELDIVMDDVRNNFGSPIVINRGASCVSHNLGVGGAIDSQHLYGKACDFYVKGVHEDDVVEYLEVRYHNKYGIGRYNGRTHIDVRPTRARWDKRSI